MSTLLDTISVFRVFDKLVSYDRLARLLDEKEVVCGSVSLPYND